MALDLSLVNSLHSFSLGKACDALGESILFDKLRPAYPVFGFGGERRVTARVEIQRHDLGQSIAAHVKRLSILQALEECDLLLVHLEQLDVFFPIN